MMASLKSMVSDGKAARGREGAKVVHVKAFG